MPYCKIFKTWHWLGKNRRWPNSRPTIILFHLCRFLLGLIFRKQAPLCHFINRAGRIKENFFLVFLLLYSSRASFTIGESVSLLFLANRFAP